MMMTPETASKPGPWPGRSVSPHPMEDRLETPIAIFNHLLGLALCLASLYLSLFVTDGADMTTLPIGAPNSFSGGRSLSRRCGNEVLWDYRSLFKQHRKEASCHAASAGVYGRSSPLQLTAST